MVSRVDHTRTARPATAHAEGRVASGLRDLLPAVPVLAWGLALALLAGVGVAGVWGLRADRDGRPETVAVGQVVDLPGGQMRVDRMIRWQDGGHGMSGMKIPDPLPKGQQRFWLYVTVKGSVGGSGVRVDRSRFTVSGDVLAPVEPHTASDHVPVVRPGAIATLTFLYQVPADASGLRLDARGATAGVSLTGPPGGTGGHHG